MVGPTRFVSQGPYLFSPFVYSTATTGLGLPTVRKLPGLGRAEVWARSGRAACAEMSGRASLKSGLKSACSGLELAAVLKRWVQLGCADAC